MGVLCDVYDRLPPDIQYKVVLASLIVKLNNILSSPEKPTERLKKAKDLADRIYSRFREKEIENIVKSLDIQLKLSTFVDQAVESLNQAISLENIDQAFQKLEETNNRIKVFFEPETRKYTSQYLSSEQMRFFESFANDIDLLLKSGYKEAMKDLSNVMNETRSLINDFQNAKAGSIEESINLWTSLRNRSMDQLNKIRDVENRLKNVASSLNLSILTGFPKTLEQVFNNINSIKITLNDLYTFSSYVNDVYSSLKSFIDLVRSLGSSNDKVLGNEGFRRSIVDSLTVLFQTTNRLYTVNLSNSDLTESLKTFANSIYESLKTYKQNLIDTDPRWLYVFDEAEKRVGINLPADLRFSKKLIDAINGIIDKLPDPVKSLVKQLMSFLGSSEAIKFYLNILDSYATVDILLTNALNDAREQASKELNSSTSQASKIKSGIITFLIGFADTISLLIRPRTAFDQMKGVFEMLMGGLRNIQEKGFKGLVEDIQFLANQMFGSIDRALYTAGSMAGAVLTGEAVARLPIPASLRGIVTDLALGDPITPFVRVVTAEKPVALLRNVVVSKAGEITETSKVFNASEYVSKLKEFVLERASKYSDQIEKTFKALNNDLIKIFREKGSIEASMSDVKINVLRYGIENLRDLALKYLDFVDKYVKPFTASDLINTLRGLADSIYLNQLKPVIDHIKISLNSDLFKQAFVMLPQRPNLSNLVEGAKYLIEEFKKTSEVFKQTQKYLGLVVRKITIPETVISKVSMIIEKDLKVLSDILAIHDVRKLVFTSESSREMIKSSKEALRFINIFSENLPEDLRKTISTRYLEISSKAVKLEDLINKISESLKKVEEKLREVRKSEEGFEKIRNVFIDFTNDIEKIVREHPDLSKLIDINKIKEGFEKISTIDDLRALINNEIINKLRGYITSESMLIIKRFGELLDLLAKDPSVASRFKLFINTLLSNVYEIEKVEMPRSFIIKLSPETLTLLMKLSPEALPKEASEILKKAINEKKLTLSELEKLTDEIAKITPVSAGAIEIKAITDALRSILKDVKIGIEKIPSELRSYLDIAVRNVEEKIYEAEKIITQKTEITRMKVIEGLSSTIRRESETILSLLKEVSPSLEERLRTSLDKLSKELSAGKVSDETIKEVMNVLREASKVLKDAGIMPGMLKRALIRFIDLLNNNVSDDVRLAKLLSPIADEIIRILNTIPEIEGWGFVSLDISTSRAGMLMASPEVRQWVREEIAKGRTVKEVKIRDVDIKLYKNIVLDPKTNTFSVEYRLVYPEGREAVIGLSTRITDGYVHRTFYSSMDPVLVQAYKDYTSGNVKSSLYKIGESLDELYKDPQRFMEMIDPDFERWKNIAMYGSKTGLVRLGDLLNASLTGLVSILSTAKLEAKPPEKLTTEDQLFLASASAPKDALINATRPLITSTPEEIAREVIEKGYSPVGYVNPKIFITEYIAPAIEKLMRSNRDIRRRILDFFNNPDILKQLGMSFGDLVKSIGVEGFLKNIMNMLPTTMLIDLVDKLRNAIPEIQDLIRKITWALDNIIIYAVPSPKPFIPSKEEWTIIKIGDLTIPVPIIGRFMGRRVTIVPVMTEKIAEEFKTKIAPVSTQVQIPFLTLQYITPETAINVPTSTEIPSMGLPLTIVSMFSIAPQLGPLGEKEARGVRKGYQREVLTIL